MLKTLLNNVKQNVDYLRPLCGLPLSTCFSALKIKWLIENVTAVKEALERDTLCFGNLDSWIMWVSKKTKIIKKYNSKY